MELWTLLVLILVSNIHSYNIRVDPRIQTSVNNLQNKGDNNSIKFSSITNSTILQALPQAILETHSNELLSTSIILSAFAIVFCILSAIINKITLSIFKLNQRISQLEARCFA